MTLAETTPVLEAAHLQADLRRAGIEPWAWIINTRVAAASVKSPLLRQRAASELQEIQAVANQYADRYAVVPLLKENRSAPSACVRSFIAGLRWSTLVMRSVMPASPVTTQSETPSRDTASLSRVCCISGVSVVDGAGRRLGEGTA